MWGNRVMAETWPTDYKTGDTHTPTSREPLRNHNLKLFILDLENQLWRYRRPGVAEPGLTLTVAQTPCPGLHLNQIKLWKYPSHTQSSWVSLGWETAPWAYRGLHGNIEFYFTLLVTICHKISSHLSTNPLSDKWLSILNWEIILRVDVRSHSWLLSP